jgi:hypothetical protein
MSTRNLISGHKNYLEATSLQKAAIIEGDERQDGREVSPLTWKDGEYQFTISWPSREDGADEDDTYQAQLAQAQRVDVNDVVARVCERLAGQDGTPMHHLLEAWVSSPPPDLHRILVAPHQCEALGRWLAIRLARGFQAAMALEA